MSHLTQMAGLTVQNFVSAAVGIAVAVALIRGLTRRRSDTIGNFWVDLVRSTTRVLLPLSVAVALLLASQGVVQSLRGPAEARTVEGAAQAIYRGPVASQEAIKELGTNGGGIVNANSAHPFENPTGFTNLVELLSLLLIPFALTYAFGRMVGNQRQGWAIFAAMFTLWIGSAAVATYFEVEGNPRDRRGRREHGGQGGALRRARLRALRRLDHRHVDGRGQRRPRQLHARRRRGAAREHDARRGLAGRRRRGPLRDARLRPARGVHRRPDGRPDAGVPREEDPGGGDEARRRCTCSPCRCSCSAFSAVSLVLETGKASILNPGPHGLSEVLYAFTSASNNNGSAFGGLTGNTDWYNTTLGLAMLGGRFLLIVPLLAIAGSLARKQPVPPTAGTFPTASPLFVSLLVGVVLIVVGLTYFPVLALGPIVEQLGL